MPSSIASALASPSCSANTASFSIGHRIRFTTKPGLFFTTIGVLPSLRASASAAATVASEVCSPRISSTSAIIGTGLKKCMPRKRSARAVTAASCVIEIDDVFDAMIAPGFASASILRRISILIAGFSVAASITRSTLASSS
jgi:hypothetical protein